MCGFNGVCVSECAAAGGGEGGGPDFHIGNLTILLLHLKESKNKRKEKKKEKMRNTKPQEIFRHLLPTGLERHLPLCVRVKSWWFAD